MTSVRQALSEADIKDRLRSLPLWSYDGKQLVRQYEGETYIKAVDALNRIARLSEEADHHPDLSLSWKHLKIAYSTHTANGVTELDFRLAAQVDAALTVE